MLIIKWMVENFIKILSFKIKVNNKVWLDNQF